MQTFFSRFQPRLIPGLAVLALLALFIHLGLWQADKAEQGEAQRALYAARSQQPPFLIGTERLAPENLVYARGAVRGEYDAAQQFYVDNQVENGRPGVHVITPLKIEGGDTRILVNRGWVAWEDRRTPPRASTPAGAVEVAGIVVIPARQKYLLVPDRQEAWPELWSVLDIERYTKVSTHPVQPMVLRLTSTANDAGLVRNWPQPEDKVAMHKGYALQWFGMAVALLGFYFIASFRRMAR